MNRRNERSKPPLPQGWELLAVAYGTGKDDYLGVVLAYQSDGGDWDKYVTWIWNSDKGCEGVGEGHYFDRPSYKDDEALFTAAWNNFIDRAEPFTRKAHTWAPEDTVKTHILGRGDVSIIGGRQK